MNHDVTSGCPVGQYYIYIFCIYYIMLSSLSIKTIYPEFSHGRPLLERPLLFDYHHILAAAALARLLAD